ncbi:hypothetical protein APY94_00835 [Thermococcus celericrescens]|uniref:Uncharacterized protein n=1 Tax=Thermococcus celericrescens TaxID=227598 RepID=A0A100XZT1_9EURY|nr:hypothetical protein [Thermococcus celericrescens]KUH34756.1 hypothetical protein APY94_00835 [Thermococcus celericrescens]
MNNTSTPKYGASGYRYLRPLAEEIILKKLERVSTARNSISPFFRENYRTKHLEFVIPFKALTSMEKHVLKEAGYPERLVRGDENVGLAKAFVIDVRAVEATSPELAEAILSAYRRM